MMANVDIQGLVNVEFQCQANVDIQGLVNVKF